MSHLSIPSATPSDEEGAGSAPPGLASRAIGRWIPALVGLVLAGLLHLEARPRDDLVMVAPGAARPGESVGVRTLFFPGEQRAEESEPVDVPVEVRLLAESGESLASAQLRVSPRFGREGSLVIPAALSGRHVLEATATLPEGRVARVRRPIDLDEDAPSLPRRGRLATPLQRLELGPIEVLDAERAPRHLELRVVGGACVPETRCALLIWAGSPGAEISVPGQRSEARPRAPLREAVARRLFTVEAAEAHTRIEAHIGGEPVASRSVQLPVALGAPAVRLDEKLVVPPDRPTLRVESAAGETSWVVDLFLEGRWQRSLSIPARAEGRLDIVGTLAPGLWTAQARRDPFPASPTGTAAFFIGERGDSPEATLRRVASRRGGADPADPMAVEIEEVLRAPAARPETLAAFMLAPEERELFVLPMAVHGVEQSAEPEKLARLRRYGASLVLLLGFLVSYLLVTAQLRAGEDLDRALKAAGIPDETLPIPRFRRWLLPLSVALFVLLVFGVVAYMVVSRGSW